MTDRTKIREPLLSTVEGPCVVGFANGDHLELPAGRWWLSRLGEAMADPRPLNGPPLFVQTPMRRAMDLPGPRFREVPK